MQQPQPVQRKCRAGSLSREDVNGGRRVHATCRSARRANPRSQQSINLERVALLATHIRTGVNAQTRDTRDLSTRSGVTPSGRWGRWGGCEGVTLQFTHAHVHEPAQLRLISSDFPSRAVLPEVDWDEEKRRGEQSVVMSQRDFWPDLLRSAEFACTRLSTSRVVGC